MAGMLDVNALRGGTATARVLSGACQYGPLAWSASIDLDDAARHCRRPQVIDGIATTLASLP